MVGGPVQAWSYENNAVYVRVYVFVCSFVCVCVCQCANAFSLQPVSQYATLDFTSQTASNVLPPVERTNYAKLIPHATGGQSTETQGSTGGTPSQPTPILSPLPLHDNYFILEPEGPAASYYTSLGVAPQTTSDEAREPTCSYSQVKTVKGDDARMTATDTNDGGIPSQTTASDKVQFNNSSCAHVANVKRDSAQMTANSFYASWGVAPRTTSDEAREPTCSYSQVKKVKGDDARMTTTDTNDGGIPSQTTASSNNSSCAQAANIKRDGARMTSANASNGENPWQTMTSGMSEQTWAIINFHNWLSHMELRPGLCPDNWICWRFIFYHW